jgi:hypothetical protein
LSAEPKKACFLNSERPCDLTCKAAFEVDDPVDNVDCSFVWLSFHAGEALFELRQVLENMRGIQGGGGGGGAPKPKGGPYGSGPSQPPGAGPGSTSDN